MKGAAKMANCQNNMRCPRWQSMPSFSPVSDGRQMDGCPNTRNDFLEGKPLAMAYVPWQQWKEIYEPCQGFQQGTIFRELDKPFLWKGGRCR